MAVKIAAIPTKYADVQFRSRLEAKYAAFFTSLGWNWAYEPFDLDGWIPDFIIHGKDENMLVEVKPFTSDLDAFVTKINTCKITPVEGQFKDILFVTYEGPQPGDYAMQLGPLGEWYPPTETRRGGWGFDKSCVTLFDGTAGGHGLWGICSMFNSYHCRITGIYNGSSGNQSSMSDESYVDSLKRRFRQAGNTTQWKAKS